MNFDYLIVTLYALSLIFILVDMLFFGFQTGIFISIGIAGIISTALLQLGLGYIIVVPIFFILTAIIFMIIYRLIKKISHKGSQSVSFDNAEFTLSGAITKSSGRADYSGTSWSVKIDSSEPYESLEQGTIVKIVSRDGLSLVVKRASTK